MHPWLRSQRPSLGILLHGSLSGVLRQSLWVNLELANSAGFLLSKIILCLPPALGVQTQVLTRVQEAITPAHILIFQSAYHPRFSREVNWGSEEDLKTKCLDWGEGSADKDTCLCDCRSEFWSLGPTCFGRNPFQEVASRPTGRAIVYTRPQSWMYTTIKKFSCKLCIYFCVFSSTHLILSLHNFPCISCVQLYMYIPWHTRPCVAWHRQLLWWAMASRGIFLIPMEARLL